MSRHWRSVEKEVGTALMPMAIDGKMQEYGCGGFGCVLPVSPGKVMKITTDASEAAFVAAALSFGDWPPGITPYDAVLSVPEEYDGLPVYLLWREEAYNVGVLADWREEDYNVGADDTSSRLRCYEDEFGYPDVEVFVDRLVVFRNKASGLLDSFRYKGAYPGVSRSPKEMLRLAGEVAQLRVASAMRANEAGQSSAVDIVQRGEQLDEIASEMAGMRFGSSVGYALRFYLRRGLVLTDVHLGNVGEIRDPGSRGDWDLAIIDPGVMVPLDPRWMRVDIPRI